jgi:hypothetical protein
MPETAAIKSLPVAFAMLKAMQAEGWKGARIIAPVPAVCSPSCWKAELLRRSIATSSAWPNAARPIGATAVTRAGCSPIELQVPRPGPSACSRWCAPTPGVPRTSTGRSWAALCSGSRLAKWRAPCCRSWADRSARRP